MAFGYFAFVRGQNVPLIAFADLGFHELGHLVSYFLPVPDIVSALMGSVTQVLVPWGLSIYFYVWRHDRLGGIFCLAWASTSLQNSSVYIADAPHQALPLIGGHHDWAFILGHWDSIHRAGAIAGAVKGLGLVLLTAAVTMCLAGLVLDRVQLSPSSGRR